MEMTGQYTPFGVRKASPVPNFESRSSITAQFFDTEFKRKAAILGVSVEWIDIGTWQLPSELILDKHKEAWNLSRENAKKLGAVERSRKRYEMSEIIELVNSIIIRNYEKPSTFRKLSNNEVEELYAIDPAAVAEYRQQLLSQGSQKKDSRAIAHEMLNAFRMELRAAISLIEKDNRPQEEKQAELAQIKKALDNISYLTDHWVRKP
jgi:hypothetical protein